MMNKDVPKFMVLAFIDDEINPPRIDASFFRHHESALSMMESWDNCNTPTELYIWIRTQLGYRFVLADDLYEAICNDEEEEQ